MGLTPLQGLVMGTRSGDVDPGLHTFLHNELGLSVGDIDNLLNKQSGLKGMAGVNDFRELEQRRRRRPGGPAGLRGLRAPAQALRRRLSGASRPARCPDLHRRGRREQPGPAGRGGRREWTGSGWRSTRAATRQPSREARVISPDGPPVTVAVVPTNEELAIAREAAALVAAQTD